MFNVMLKLWKKLNFSQKITVALVGFFVLTLPLVLALTYLQTNLSPRAGDGGMPITPPVPPAGQPIFADDFSDKSGGWHEEAIVDNPCVKEYDLGQGKFRVLARWGDICLTSRSFTTNQWTIISDFKANGTAAYKLAGIVFGGRIRQCDLGSRDCFWLLYDSDGFARLFYFDPRYRGWENITDQRAPISIRNGQDYKIRVDRSDNSLKAWISSDNGNTWYGPNTFTLVPNTGQGTWAGLIAATGEDAGNNETLFDNFRMYRLGDLPEPQTLPWPSSSPTPTSTPIGSGRCPLARFGDVNCDGVVDIVDIGIIIDNFGRR